MLLLLLLLFATIVCFSLQHHATAIHAPKFVYFDKSNCKYPSWWVEGMSQNMRFERYCRHHSRLPQVAILHSLQLQWYLLSPYMNCEWFMRRLTSGRWRYNSKHVQYPTHESLSFINTKRKLTNDRSIQGWIITGKQTFFDSLNCEDLYNCDDCHDYMTIPFHSHVLVDKSHHTAVFEVFWTSIWRLKSNSVELLMSSSAIFAAIPDGCMSWG